MGSNNRNHPDAEMKEEERGLRGGGGGAGGDVCLQADAE